jgi:hypothetical protein
MGISADIVIVSKSLSSVDASLGDRDETVVTNLNQENLVGM